MKISTTEKVFSTQSRPEECGDLVTWLRGHSTHLPKDQAPLWSPTTFTEGRKEAQAVEVSALVFDFDNGRPDLNLLKLVGHAWHTSASHTAETPKWRLVIPLDRPIAAKDWTKFWSNAAAALQITGHDVACGNVGRFYYVPPVTAIWETYNGRPMPVDDVLTKYSVKTQGDDLLELRSLLLKARNSKYEEAIRKGLAGQPCYPNGSRDVGVTALGFYLGRSVVGADIDPDAVYRTLERGLDLPGEPYRPKEHWETKFKDAFKRGREKRAELAEASVKAQGLDAPWSNELQTITKMDGSKSIISNAYNVSVILRCEGSNTFRKNLLEDTLEYTTHDSEWRPMQDADCTRVANWLQKAYRVNISRQQVYDQIDAIAPHYDPLATYIAGLQWDGQQRITDFLLTTLGCEDSPQVRMYSRKWFIGLAARALKPGCKLDTVLVLQGDQGLGKSTALRLITEPWFSDSKIVIGDKDSMQSAARFWCHEFGELASIKRGDLDTIKAFLTSTTDSFRPPYGRTTVVKPRRCVYVATANHEAFLEDPTGGRRFWIAKVVRPIDFDAIKRVRDQLIAEAAIAFRAGEAWWLTTDEERASQKENAEEYHTEDNSLQKDTIVKWWCARPFSARPEYLTTAQVLGEIWNVPVERANRTMEMQAGYALKSLGFVRRRLNRSGFQGWVYKPSPDFEKMPQRGTNGEVKDFKREDGKDHG